MGEQLPAAKNAREQLSQACTLLDTIREDTPMANRIEAAEAALDFISVGDEETEALLKQLMASVPDPTPAKSAPATSTSKPASSDPAPVGGEKPDGVQNPHPPPAPA